jgi:hypothetical protein
MAGKMFKSGGQINEKGKATILTDRDTYISISLADERVKNR